MLDAVRGYLQLAGGLTEVALRKAFEAVDGLLAGDEDAEVLADDPTGGSSKADRVPMHGLADDLIGQASAGAESLTSVIRGEIDRTAGRLGFVREEELAAVRRHVARLEGQLVQVRADLAAMGDPGGAAPTLAKPRTKPAPSQPAGGPATAATSPAEPKPAKRKVPVRPAEPGTGAAPEGGE